MQNLPLQYPTMIKKFIEQGSNCYQVDFTFNDTAYVIEPLGDDFDVMRITNQATQNMINLTVHDYISNLAPMSEWMAVLNYIESQVKFGVTDWVEHYTSKFMQYRGSTLSINRMDGGTGDIYVTLHAMRDMYFRITPDDEIEPVDNLTFGFAIKDKTTCEIQCVPAPMSSNEQITYLHALAHDMLLRAFNNEYVLNTHISSPQMQSGDAALNNDIWSLPSNVQGFGCDVTLNHDVKTVTFTKDDFKYTIEQNGNWSKSRIPKATNVLDGNQMMKPIVRYCTYFNFIELNDFDEYAYVRGLVHVLNSIELRAPW